MGEARAARWSDDGERLFFRVHNHKTGKTSGSVEVHLAKLEGQLFFLYAQYRRELGSLKDEDAFFVQGRASSMSTSLAIEFQKLATSLDLDCIPCPTRLRKAIQSLAPVETLRDREALAQLLHHSPAVAVTHYRRRTTEDKVVSRNLLHRVLAATDGSEERDPPKPAEAKRWRLVDYSSDESGSSSESDGGENHAAESETTGPTVPSQTGCWKERQERHGLSYRASVPVQRKPSSKKAERRKCGPFSPEAIVFLRAEFADWLENGMPRTTKKAIERALVKGRELLGGRDYRSVYFKLKALARDED